MELQSLSPPDNDRGSSKALADKYGQEPGWGIVRLLGGALAAWMKPTTPTLPRGNPSWITLGEYTRDERYICRWTSVVLGCFETRSLTVEELAIAPNQSPASAESGAALVKTTPLGQKTRFTRTWITRRGEFESDKITCYMCRIALLADGFVYCPQYEETFDKDCLGDDIAIPGQFRIQHGTLLDKSDQYVQYTYCVSSITTAHNGQSQKYIELSICIDTESETAKVVYRLEGYNMPPLQ
jgi:hypothetical protein